LWRARSQISIAPGDIVRVSGVDGLTLDVEPAKDAPITPNTTSVVDH
jgi:membrane-bound ClpP family serine protease